MSVPGWLRKETARRANGRCEYCCLSQKGQEAAFHVDHVHPSSEGGETESENLALACVSCSLRKGARLRASDPRTGRNVVLFHPRLQTWAQHFMWKGDRVGGKTSTGRATVELLKMNRLLAVVIRREERVHGRHPPP